MMMEPSEEPSVDTAEDESVLQRHRYEELLADYNKVVKKLEVGDFVNK